MWDKYFFILHNIQAIITWFAMKTQKKNYGIKQVQLTIQIKTSGIKYNKTLYFLVRDRNLLVLLNIQAIIAWSAMKTLFFLIWNKDKLNLQYKLRGGVHVIVLRKRWCLKIQYAK